MRDKVNTRLHYTKWGSIMDKSVYTLFPFTFAKHWCIEKTIYSKYTLYLFSREINKCNANQEFSLKKRTQLWNVATIFNMDACILNLIHILAKWRNCMNAKLIHLGKVNPIFSERDSERKQVRQLISLRSLLRVTDFLRLCTSLYSAQRSSFLAFVKLQVFLSFVVVPG